MYRRPNLVWLGYGYGHGRPDCNQPRRIASIYSTTSVLITNTPSPPTNQKSSTQGYNLLFWVVLVFQDFYLLQFFNLHSRFWSVWASVCVCDGLEETNGEEWTCWWVQLESDFQGFRSVNRWRNSSTCNWHMS